ncbi:hypothetical protein QKW45_11545 [Streptomyces sp. AJ-1]|uniref:hypothetical protein n=1 Tax=Streptomyces sp. AJ-1 TaxID=3044384 RepID=UPI00249A3731|nr:hypothetical protein [Streptomyces sp. AJ-1]MDI3344358.1 hypothetical protein [Streptomyces sp. AJ-1]
MRTFIGGQEAVSDFEFTELAFGFEEFPVGLDRELFCGPAEPETPEERTAREDAAADVLADLREQAEGGDEIAAWDALYADALTGVVPLRQRRRAARTRGTGEAA